MVSVLYNTRIVFVNKTESKEDLRQPSGSGSFCLCVSWALRSHRMMVTMPLRPWVLFWTYHSCPIWYSLPVQVYHLGNEANDALVVRKEQKRER